ncbi:MAG: glycosyltransferase family 4 protein [Dysgonomonas mossii]|uniref:glycosyltransferase family 4 protein n=1 Tax=Dysgonomonas TaxID=156973 RepID=UPI00208EE669|nr:MULTISPECIES: glycosyltransferase family 1 protein [Dysgonomonas]
MKIAIDMTPLYNRKLTGVENYGIELYQALIKTSADVYPIFRMENILDNNPNTIIIKESNRLLVDNLLLSKTVRSLNIKSVIFPIFPPPIDIYWRKKYLVATTIHDLAFKHFSSTLSLNARIYIKPKLNLALKHADKIITISETVKKEIEKYTNKQVINWGENISKKYLQTEDYIKEAFLSQWELKPDNYFLSVSTIEPRKNFKYLLQIFKEYRNIDHSIKLVLVGRKGWGKDKELNRLVTELSNSIIFTNYISNEELMTLYHYSKAFFLLSLYEGFGRTPLEALACDARVFVSDIPIFRETLKENVIYLPLNDIDNCIKILNNYDFTSNKKKNIDIPFDILDNNISKNFKDLIN